MEGWVELGMGVNKADWRHVTASLKTNELVLRGD